MIEFLKDKLVAVDVLVEVTLAAVDMRVAFRKRLPEVCSSLLMASETTDLLIGKTPISKETEAAEYEKVALNKRLKN